MDIHGHVGNIIITLLRPLTFLVVGIIGHCLCPIYFSPLVAVPARLEECGLQVVKAMVDGFAKHPEILGWRLIKMGYRIWVKQ
jgi:hypothetical protein